MNRRAGKLLQPAFERLFDVTCAAAGLLLLLPVLTALALVVLCDDGPPVLFSQTRVGRNGRPFRIWKFRTMRAGSVGRPITAAGDNRITRTGAGLRRWKLDELPQLFNVLKGDMSLVGPRPEVPEYVRFEMPIWKTVLGVRPGITDLASLLYRDEETTLGASDDPNTFYEHRVLPAKLLLNLEYLQTKSFWRNLWLIWLSIRYSLLPETFDPELVRRAFHA